MSTEVLEEAVKIGRNKTKTETKLCIGPFCGPTTAPWQIWFGLLCPWSPPMLRYLRRHPPVAHFEMHKALVGSSTTAAYRG